ncbi:hypothetical protein LTR56_008834 [Elasticomyces elasticus]|nr:hypothetical protein LTR22_015826 [Elasticomyces elasticus]KAK3645956.1 hypothetical protein LTR56_008834 [Elasticomyces elasticus]KAK4914824.1 hypothetical protein LTR49_016936 [Elasticomyces elasticus]KAK5730172.1 hypothetical protein LTR15_000106 [Elasticomyces elasticus]KAK5754102.1 hypothetical protein LTS12_015856 [Elasticomyces elasticus]
MLPHIEQHLLLPAAPRTRRMDEDKIRAMAEFHAAMYINKETKSTVLLLQKAERDVAAIWLAFPDLQNESTVLAMAAWLALLCNVDDEIERLDANTAQLALSDSAAILASSMRNNERSPQRYSGACLNPACDSIRAWTKNFVRQLRGLVPQAVYINVVNNVLDVWEALQDEAYLREDAVSDVGSYLEIRTRTVGLRPFFDLLQADLQLDDDELAREPVIWQLEQNVTLAVALQNDIVGLKRDLADAEPLNIISMAAGMPDSDLRSASDSAVDMHNQAASAACALASSLSDLTRTSELGAASQRYANSVCALIATHFAWVSSAKRYA